MRLWDKRSMRIEDEPSMRLQDRRSMRVLGAHPDFLTLGLSKGEELFFGGARS